MRASAKHIVDKILKAKKAGRDVLGRVDIEHLRSECSRVGFEPRIKSRNIEHLLEIVEKLQKVSAAYEDHIRRVQGDPVPPTDGDYGDNIEDLGLSSGLIRRLREYGLDKVTKLREELGRGLDLVKVPGIGESGATRILQSLGMSEAIKQSARVPSKTTKDDEPLPPAPETE